MLEETHIIFDEDRPSQGPNDARQVRAWAISNLERASKAAALNGHAAVVSTLAAFATEHDVEISDIFHKITMMKIIKEGNGAVVKAIASADPDIVNMVLSHGGSLPIYEAVKLRKTDVVAALLECGADPLRPVISKSLGTYGSSLMSLAVRSRDPRMVELLLEHGGPVTQTGALHTAAAFGDLDTMRILMQRGADKNEVLSEWKSWTPLHFAASDGQADAMKLLEQSGARSDMKDSEEKTPAQVLAETNTA